MYKQTTSVKVNKFLEDVSKRNTKIDSKVNELDLQINSLNQEVSKLQEDIVEYDLNKDVNSKNTATKEISKFKIKLNDLISERNAYVEAKKPGNRSLKAKAEKINVIAEKEIDQIHVLITEKRDNILKLDAKKIAVEEEIKNEELELQNLEWNINNIEDDQIHKITKYIGVQEDEKHQENRAAQKATAYIKFSNDDGSKSYIKHF